MSIDTRAALLRAMFDAAVEAVGAPRFLPPLLPPEGARPMTLFALGKAGASMAAVACRHRRIELGLVVTRHGHVPPGMSFPPGVRVIEADHPVPGEAGLAAARAAMEMARSLDRDDHLLALVSGGGSALLPLPAAGVTLADKQAVTRGLLDAGAPIADINAVRRALSAIKGGKLADAAAPARVTTIVLSDVPGDDPADVASGPTIRPNPADPDAATILARWGIAAPSALPIRTAVTEDASPSRRHVTTGATARDALAAAARIAAAAGYRVVDLGGALGGPLRSIVDRHRALVDDMRGDERVALLSGGEAEVAVPAGAPLGGRNAAFLIEMALALGQRNAAIIACDTDGIDGTGEAAGGMIGPDGLTRLSDNAAAVRRSLAAGDAAGLVRRYGMPIVTGPTFTNVNDFRAILLG